MPRTRSLVCDSSGKPADREFINAAWKVLTRTWIMITRTWIDRLIRDLNTTLEHVLLKIRFEILCWNTCCSRLDLKSCEEVAVHVLVLSRPIPLDGELIVFIEVADNPLS